MWPCFESRTIMPDDGFSPLICNNVNSDLESAERTLSPPLSCCIEQSQHSAIEKTFKVAIE